MKWTPTAAHSILNTTTNDLSGGLILRASVTFDDDDRNANDQRDEIIPVAVDADEMDDFPTNGNTGFISGKYPADGGDAEGAGSWETDSTTSAAGSKHWRLHARKQLSIKRRSHAIGERSFGNEQHLRHRHS